MMGHQLNWRCEQHTDPFECPDALVKLSDDRAGLIIHDGGSSTIRISHCRWCGTPIGTTIAD